MELKITLTNEQEAALIRRNAELYPDEVDRPPAEQLGVQLASDALDFLVGHQRENDVKAVTNKIEANAGFLTAEDFAAIDATVEAKKPV